MPELQIDVTVANRFISSLSKSLQALCHGCMDFDSGIEIVGYINVNIDCGSKVDYVLNEKVLKSTTNSMTFVSNSFLARKEQQKQTRDGMCSPIRELNQPQPPAMSSFQSRARGYLHGMHSRSGTTPVSHSYGHHSSQKRSWTGLEKDSRMSPKKSRDGRPSPHESGSTTQRTHSNPTSSSFSQNSADVNFMWPQTSFQGSDKNTDNHEEVNIKKELLESDSGKDVDQSEQDQSQTDQDANDNTDPVSRVPNIKCDPDASTAVSNEEAGADEPTDVTDNDYKGTFLDPSTSEKNEDNSEHSTGQADANEDDEKTAAASHQPEDFAVAEEPQAENVAAGSEDPAEFDETGEEGAYAHSVYSDAGEGSNDAGQFEVIEIEDEDEDVQAMFGEPQHPAYDQWTPEPRLRRQTNHRSGKLPHISTLSPFSISSTSSATSASHSAIPNHDLSVSCTICNQVLENRFYYQRHMNEYHRESMPYTCSHCQRGFFSKVGLHQHELQHTGQLFPCTWCTSSFTFKRNLNRHIEMLHGIKFCRHCGNTYKVLEAASHVCANMNA